MAQGFGSCYRAAFREGGCVVGYAVGEGLQLAAGEASDLRVGGCTSAFNVKLTQGETKLRSLVIQLYDD